MARVCRQNAQFLKGYKTYPNVLKGYKNIKPAKWFTSNEKKFAELEKRIAKKETELAALKKARQKHANTIAPALNKSRASARITLKAEKVSLRIFLG